MKKKYLIILGLVLLTVGLVFIYFGYAPIPSLMIVLGYVLFGFGLIPERKEDGEEKEEK